MHTRAHTHTHRHTHGLVPQTVLEPGLKASPYSLCWFQGYFFHMSNPYKDCPNAFEEGLQKSREGDLTSAVQLLEAAILQDPQDSEVHWICYFTAEALKLD